MAYFQNENEEDDKQNGAQGMNSSADSGSAPVQLSGQSSTMTTTAGNKSAAPASSNIPKAASSGAGPGFQSYTKANQGKAQDKLNNSVSQNVANAGQSATNAINQANTAFGQKVDAGSLANRENAVQDVTNITNNARKIAAQQISAAPVAQPTANTGTSATATQAPPAQPNALSAINQLDQNRFKEVINAKYQGPESLRQAGLYEQTAGKVGTAQTAIDNTKTATGREELLRNMYQQRGDYTSGLNKLDSALLNSNKQGVQNLQNTAAAQGNLGQKLDKAQINSANLAQNRTAETKQIQEQARTAFTEGKKAEEAATEGRMDKMLVEPALDANGKPIPKLDATGKPMTKVSADGKVEPVYQTQWDQLPEQFRDVIRNKDANNKAMQAELAAKVKTSPEYLQAQSEVASAQAALQKIPPTITHYNSNRGFDFQLPNPAYQQAQAAVNAAQSKAQGILNATPQVNMNSVNFNSLEAGILGIGAGEGLYKLGTNAIKQGVAKRDQLISKDEQARQAALAALAGLDLSNRLDTNLKYADASKAGTQSIMDSLDLEGTRAGLNEAEKNFQTYAEGADITGYGNKKNKTNGKRYYAQESANLGDLLKNGGYQFGEAENAKTMGNADLLKLVANVSNRQGTPNGGALAKAGEAAGDMYEMGGSTVGRDALDAYASVGGNALAGALGYESFTDMFQDGYGKAMDGNGMIPGLNPVLDEIGLGGVMPSNRDIINLFTLGQGGNLMDGVMNTFLGSGANTKQSKSDAARFAREDLERKIQDSINSSGFQNRTNIVNNDTTASRATALQQLLANLDKTNS